MVLRLISQLSLFVSVFKKILKMNWTYKKNFNKNAINEAEIMQNIRKIFYILYFLLQSAVSNKRCYWSKLDFQDHWKLFDSKNILAHNLSFIGTSFTLYVYYCIVNMLRFSLKRWPAVSIVIAKHWQTRATDASRLYLA